MGFQTVHLFVFDTLSDWEPGFAIAGLNSPAFQVAPGRYQVKTVGAATRPVTTAGGLTILPDMTLDALAPSQSAMLILPGGGGWEAGLHTEALDKARAFLAAGVPVAAICGATFGLAQAGLLDDRPHTSNAREYLQMTGYRGGAAYLQLPAVTAGDLITASAMTPLDFAYHIFKKLDVYAPPVLETWYGLYKTGDPAYFFTLQQLAAAPAGEQNLRNQTALLIVDAQVNMFAEGASVYEGEKILQTLRRLIDQARATGRPVIFVQNNGGEGDPDQPGTPGWQIHPALAPAPDDGVIQKHAPNAFHETPLQSELAARQVGRLIIAGMQSEFCIEATCRGAHALGYDVTLVADGHSTYAGGGLTAAQIIAQQNDALQAVIHVKVASALPWGEK